MVRLRSGLLHAERAEVPTARSTPAAALSALGFQVPVSVARGTAHVPIGTLAPGRVARPADGASVAAAFSVSGTASVFEATLVVVTVSR